jgi:hypothetical protein
MRVVITLIAAVMALTLASAAYADCGCNKKSSCSQKQESCGCSKHKQCGGDVQLLPDAPQDAQDLPQCCEQAQYSICCGHETFKLLCHEEPCKVQKCENKCGCNKCDKCSHKRCGCGKCPKRRSKEAVIE